MLPKKLQQDPALPWSIARSRAAIITGALSILFKVTQQF
jgi:hypothetical protein